MKALNNDDIYIIENIHKPKSIKNINRHESRLYDEVINYMNGKFTLQDVYQQIQNKTCNLSSRCRDYVSNMFDENGNFKN